MEFIKRNVNKTQRNGQITIPKNVGVVNNSIQSTVGGNYLPALANEDGSYTVDLTNVLFTGNLTAAGEVAAYKGGNSEGGNYVSVYDGLDSTDPSIALSANQGRILRELINNLSDEGLPTFLIDQLTLADEQILKYDSEKQAWVNSDSIELDDYYNKEEVNTLIDDIKAGNVDLANYYTKSEIDTKIEEIDLSDYYTKSEIDSHTENTTIHITGSERSSWNGAVEKAHTHENKSVLDGISSTKVSKWDNTSTNFGDWFYKDSYGKVHSRYSFVGDSEISAHGSGEDESFTVIDNLLSTSTTSALSANQGRLLKQMIDNIGDVDLSNYYNKSEIDKLIGDIQAGDVDLASYYNKTEINQLLQSYATVSNLNNLSTNLTNHIGDTTKHITATERTNWNTAYTNNHTHSNKTVLDGITTTLISNWNTAYTNSHTHSNKSVLDGITSTKVANWDGVVTNWDKAFYYDSSGNLRAKVNVIGEKEISAYGAGESTGGGAITVVDGLTSTSKTAALSANQGRVLRELIDNIDSSGGVDLNWSNITDKPTFATVATSGSYTDLTNKPTIPTNTNQLTNGAGYITGITKSMVTTALGYTPPTTNTTYSAGTGLKLSGTTFSADGSAIINSLSEGTSPAERTDYIVAQYAGGGTTTTSYHRRSLANVFAALTKSDITTALGFTPYNATNPNGYITSSGSITGNAATATTASKLSATSKTAWGQTYWTSGGVPTNINGDMSSVGHITPNAHNGRSIGAYDNSFLKVHANYLTSGASSNNLLLVGGSSAPYGILFALNANGGNSGHKMAMDSNRLYPYTDGGMSLGSTYYGWKALYLNTGDDAYGDADIYFNSGGTTYARIGSNDSGNLGLYARTSVVIRGGATGSNAPTTGMEIDKDGVSFIKSNTAYGVIVKRLNSSGGAFTKYLPCNQTTKSWAAGVDNSYRMSWWYQDTSQSVDKEMMWLDNTGVLSLKKGVGDRQLIMHADNATIYHNSTTSSGWTMGNYFRNNAGTSVLGGYAAYGSGNTLSYHFIGNDYSAPLLKIDTSGNCIAKGEVTAHSDKRLKSDIKPLEVRGELNPVTYVKDGKESIGFIADEVKEVYPELVIEDDATPEKYLTLNYAQLTAVLYAEIKELKKEIAELKKKIE